MEWAGDMTYSTDPTAQEATGNGATTIAAAGPDRVRDPLVAALGRYVEALRARYPDGPDQMRKETLDARANMRRMSKSEKVTAA
jgi:hypothetical protein